LERREWVVEWIVRVYVGGIRGESRDQKKEKNIWNIGGLDHLGARWRIVIFEYCLAFREPSVQVLRRPTPLDTIIYLPHFRLGRGWELFRDVSEYMVIDTKDIRLKMMGTLPYSRVETDLGWKDS
jgi:hypothetical protein